METTCKNRELRLKNKWNWEVQKRADSNKCRQLLPWCIPHACNEMVFRSLSTHTLGQHWRQDKAELEHIWRRCIFYSWSTWEHWQNFFIFKLWQITSPQCGYGKLHLTLWQGQASTVCYTASGCWARHPRNLESHTGGSSHPVWRDMYQTLGWNFHSSTTAKAVAANGLLVLVTDHHPAALRHCGWGTGPLKWGC